MACQGELSVNVFFFFFLNGYVDIDRKLQSLLEKQKKKKKDKRNPPPQLLPQGDI